MGVGVGGARAPSHAAYYVALAGVLALLLLLLIYFAYFCAKRVKELVQQEYGSRTPASYPVQPVVREGARAMAKLCQQLPAGAAVFPAPPPPAAPAHTTPPAQHTTPHTTPHTTRSTAATATTDRSHGATSSPTHDTGGSTPKTHGKKRLSQIDIVVTAPTDTGPPGNISAAVR